MIDAEIIQDGFYAISDMIRNLRVGIFSKTNYLKNVDIFRNILRRSFINQLANLFDSKEVKNSDINATIRGEIRMLNFHLTATKDRRIDRITKYYYKDCIAKIKEILDPK